MSIKIIKKYPGCFDEWHTFEELMYMNKKAKSSPTIKKKLPAIAVAMEDKSPEQRLEDLIGILNNRKELLEKLIKKFPRSHDGHKTFFQYHKQTKKFLSVLLVELSAYGDGTAGPDPHNEYNDYWKAALKKWDSINHHRLIPFWRELENILKDTYKKMLAFTPVFTASFQTILADQLAELEK